MTSKIKVDNINKVSDDSNIIKKCGTTVTVGAASDGVRTGANNLQASDGGNLISQSGTTITLGASGDTIALASGASQTGFGNPGQLVDWQTSSIKTATFTATANEGYFCNTTGGSFTVNLPAGSAGAIISINDYARTFGTNAIQIVPNGTEKISGVNAGVTGATNGQTLTFIYVDATQGWINTIDSDAGIVPTLFFTATGGTEVITGDYKTHIFTGPGTFSVTGTAPGPSGNPNAVEYLVVAGGGAGNGSPNGTSPAYTGGGGGAGGMRFNYPGTCFTGAAGSFPITVGAGGTIQPSISGSPSTFSTITSAGGGGPGAAGGSGGGQTSTPTGPGAAGGAGNTPPVSPPQGAPGGGSPLGRYGGAGGGGGGACGTAGSSTSGGPGTEVADAFIGPAVSACYGTPGPAGRFFAGGGGGALIQPASSGGGGSGGGGPGTGVCSPSPGGAATSGTTNTGGGGGAAARYPGGSNGGQGGSGIVMIRYKFQ